MQTLVKCKIVLEDKGKKLTTYFWVKDFLFFGRWVKTGSVISGDGKKIIQTKINKLDRYHIGKILYEFTKWI